MKGVLLEEFGPLGRGEATSSQLGLVFWGQLANPISPSTQKPAKGTELAEPGFVS
jgi:hypothetical protein